MCVDWNARDRSCNPSKHWPSKHRCALVYRPQFYAILLSIRNISLQIKNFGFLFRILSELNTFICYRICQIAIWRSFSEYKKKVLFVLRICIKCINFWILWIRFFFVRSTELKQSFIFVFANLKTLFSFNKHVWRYRIDIETSPAVIEHYRKLFRCRWKWDRFFPFCFFFLFCSHLRSSVCSSLLASFGSSQSQTIER